MNKLQEAVFKAIDTITDKKIGELKFDQTIECIIENTKDAEKGRYEARYQDLIITIFSSSNTVKYKVGENVYVLVPKGDMSNKKTIIGKVEPIGEEYITLESVLDKIELYGENYVIEPAGHEFTIKLINSEVKNPRELAFKTSKFIKDYKGKLNLLIGATIKSNLPKTPNADFGIKLKVSYGGNPHEYKLSMKDMVGNPYALANGYQYVVLPLIQGRDIQPEVKGIYLYVDGFEEVDQDVAQSIKESRHVTFSNIEVSYARPKDAEELDNFSAKMKAEKGTVFKNGIIDTKNRLTLEIMPQKQNSSFTPTAVYKWFSLDGRVDSEDHPNWDIDGGKGWFYINPPKPERKKTEEKEETYLKTDLDGVRVRDDGKKIEISPSAVANLETFKCVAIFGGESIMGPDNKPQVMGVVKVEASETIMDQSDPVNVVITSTKGDVFKPQDGVTETTLQCKVFVGLTEEDPSKFDYRWFKASKEGTLEPVEEFNGLANLTVKDVNDIIDTRSYICEVYTK